MNRRQFIGWLAVGVGIFLMIVAVHSMHKFSKEKEVSVEVKQFFTQNPLWNPIIKFFGGKPQVKPPEHNMSAIITQTIGIALVVVGGVFVFVSKPKKRR